MFIEFSCFFQLIDYESDGDLDLFVGAGDWTLLFYRNLGTAADASFRLESSQFAGAKADFVAVPALGDLDDDGDMARLPRLREIAREHAMTVVMANCAGVCDGARCAGRSAAWDAAGERLRA